MLPCPIWSCLILLWLILLSLVESNTIFSFPWLCCLVSSCFFLTGMLWSTRFSPFDEIWLYWNASHLGKKSKKCGEPPIFNLNLALANSLKIVKCGIQVQESHINSDITHPTTKEKLDSWTWIPHFRIFNELSSAEFRFKNRASL